MEDRKFPDKGEKERVCWESGAEATTSGGFLASQQATVATTA